MRIAPLVTLLLVTLPLISACGPDPSTPQGQCASQAMDDPTVKEIQMRGLGNTNTAQALMPDLADAKKNATLRCLRARGLAPAGGVEKERRED